MKIYVSCDIEGLAGIATFDMEKEDTVLCALGRNG